MMVCIANIYVDRNTHAQHLQTINQLYFHEIYREVARYTCIYAAVALFFREFEDLLKHGCVGVGVIVKLSITEFPIERFM